MKKCFSFLLLCAFCSSTVFGQATLQNQEHSILKVIKTENNSSKVCELYLKLGRLYFAQGSKETEYLNKAVFYAEQSRDRKLIADSYLKMADQLIKFNTPERSQLALQAIEKGLRVSKEAQLNKEAATLLVKKAVTFRLAGNISEALKYNEESISYASLSKSDSIQILCEISHANTLIAKDENLAAFKKYMHALNLAEIAKNQKPLQANLYSKIAEFYVKVGQVEKAKDNFAKGLQLSKELKDSSLEIASYMGLISLYAAEKDFASAKEYLQIIKQKGKSSVFYNQYAVSAESTIIAQEDIKKLPQFVNQNKDLFADYQKYGMYSEMYRLKGIIATIEKQNDSADFYFNLSKQQLNPNNLTALLGWNNSYAYYLEQNGKYMDAAKYIDENVLIAKKMQSLSFEKLCYEYLDSMYVKAGDKEKEAMNKLLLYQIKDSLNKQQKANDLLNIEIDIENKRNERAATELREKTERRNNLQYMGISGVILFLFIALAAMGKFKVKPWFIRALGFLSFILLFEFIILLIDHQIHAITHGEPLPILLIKIVIIAFLLPFHHWLEHKVISYLMRNTAVIQPQIHA